MSRSTWACELKSVKTIYVRYNTKVTLHVSVWVEMTDEEPTEEEPTGHAPRERVSWNENVCTDFQICCGHAPRERVSWNLLYFS